MNIGIIVSYFTPYVRGPEYGLAKSLSDLGHNVTIITSTARAPREKAFNSTTAYGEPVYNFKVKYLPTLIDFGDNPIVTGIEDYIKDKDVIMLVEDYPLICHKAFGILREYNIPTVLSSERTYYPISNVKRYALKVLDATINRRLRNDVDVLTAHCTAAREFMIEKLGVKREIAVIHVGVDTDLFKPVQPKREYLTKGDFRILTVARLHKYKGLEYLIKAMRIIKEEIPGAHLYIRGKGQEERNLKNLIDKMRLNSAVSFLTTPVPDYKKMPELYAECDVYVQPSIIEPFGIAVVEAMACGKPVVGTKVGGMRDTINEGETGFLVDPMDDKQLAERIILLSDQKLCKEKGNFARERMKNRFDWKYIASKYLEEIDAIR